MHLSDQFVLFSHRDNNGNTSRDSYLIAGEVNRVLVNLDISNNAEDAFRPVLLFELPTVFINPSIQNVSKFCTIVLS